MVKTVNINYKIFENFNKLKPATNSVQHAWLTLLYGCNLKCPWCYASMANSESFSMDYEKAMGLIDLLWEIGVRSITLIGGEPTLYSHLEDLVSYIKSKGISTTLVSNGVLLSDQKFVDRLVECGVDSFSISIKGCSNIQYQNVSNGVYTIDTVLSAINNIAKHKKEVGLKVSYVITHENIVDFIHMIDNCKKNGAERFSFTFCYDFSWVEKKIADKYNIIDNILIPLKWFQDNYHEIDTVTKGDFRIKQSLPLCAWDKNILRELEAKNQISYTCQLLKHSGLIFNPDFTIIPCNALHNVKIGKYMDDFETPQEFYRFWRSNEVSYFFKCFQTLPDNICLNCDEKIKCRGGCVSNWFNFSLSDFKESLKLFQGERNDI